MIPKYAKHLKTPADIAVMLDDFLKSPADPRCGYPEGTLWEVVMSEQKRGIYPGITSRNIKVSPLSLSTQIVTAPRTRLFPGYSLFPGNKFYSTQIVTAPRTRFYSVSTSSSSHPLVSAVGGHGVDHHP